MGTRKVSHMGLDCHKNFSRVTARDEHEGSCGVDDWSTRIDKS